MDPNLIEFNLAYLRAPGMACQLFPLGFQSNPAFIFNNNRSILAPSRYNRNQQIRSFTNLPANQKVTLVGIKIMNYQTHFAHYKLKADSKTIKLEYEQMNYEEMSMEFELLGIF
jgi:hypothetical protein